MHEGDGDGFFLGKSIFIVKMTGPVKVRPVSSNFSKAALGRDLWVWTENSQEVVGGKEGKQHFLDFWRTVASTQTRNNETEKKAVTQTSQNTVPD